MVHNGQRVAPGPVASEKLALEVSAPEIVWLMCQPKGLRLGRDAPAQLPLFDQPLAAKDIINGRLRRENLLRVLSAQKSLYFLRPRLHPALCSYRYDLFADAVWSALGRQVRFPGTLLQTLDTLSIIPTKPFISYLSAYPVAFTEIHKRSAASQVVRNK